MSDSSANLKMSSSLPDVHSFFSERTRLDLLQRYADEQLPPALVASSASLPSVDEFFSERTRTELRERYGSASAIPYVHDFFSEQTRLDILDRPGPAQLHHSILAAIAEYEEEATSETISTAVILAMSTSAWDDPLAAGPEPALTVSGRRQFTHLGEVLEESRHRLDAQLPIIEPTTDVDGTLAIGTYSLDERLGVGGMGLVYRATHRETGRTYALKLIKSGRLADEDDIARFRAEIAHLARLRHPNIIRLRDFGFAGQHEYFVMDLVDGLPLSAWIGRHQPSAEIILALMTQVCEAVDYANRHGIVHRDLNPNNILIDETGEPFVMDFGLARDLGTDTRMTVTGVAVGTPPFMAPEQTIGKEGSIGPRTDVWGIAATLYHCFTGRPPFDGESSHEIYTRIHEVDPTPPRRHRPDLNPVVERIILRGLQKLPEERYANVSDMGHDLRAVLGGERPHVKLPGLGRRLSRRARKRPITIGVMSLLVLLIVGLGGYAWWTWHQQWGGWSVELEQDFTGTERIDKRFHWRSPRLTPVADGAIKDQTVSLDNGGLILKHGGNEPNWLWFAAPGLAHGATVAIDVTMTVPDAVELVINASDEHSPARWRLPAGWVLKLNVPDLHKDDQQPNQLRGAYVDKPIIGGLLNQFSIPVEPEAGGRFRMLVRRHGGILEIDVNGVQQTISRPLSDLWQASRTPSSIALRCFQPETRITNVTVYRRAQGSLTSPLASADTLYRSGLIDAAIDEYTVLASDFTGSRIGEQALLQAVMLAGRQRADRPGLARSLARRFAREYPRSDVQIHVDEVLTRLAWLYGRFDEALIRLDDLQQRDPKNRLVLDLLGERRPRMGHDLAVRLTRHLLRVPDESTLNLSHIGLRSLDVLRGHTLKSLTIDHNPISDLTPIRDCGLTSLSANHCAISNLSPLQGLAFWSLSLSGNPITDPEPLRSIQIHSELKLSGTDLSRMVAIPFTDTEDKGPSIDIRGTAIDELSWLPDNTVSLNITDCPIENLSDLTGFHYLTTLHADNTRVSDLTPLLSCPALERLHCYASPLSDPTQLAQLPLRELRTGRLPSVPFLSICSPTLTSLLVSDMAFTTEPDFATLHDLNACNLSRCELTRVPPSGHPHLTALELNNNLISVIPDMQGYPNLARFYLGRCPLTDLTGLASLPDTLVRFSVRPEVLRQADLGPAIAASADSGQFIRARTLAGLRDYTRGSRSALRLHATRSGSSSFLFLPLHLHHEAARQLAEDCGGRLACIPDPHTQQVCLQMIYRSGVQGMIGLTVDNQHRSSWHGGGRSHWQPSASLPSPGFYTMSVWNRWVANHPSSRHYDPEVDGLFIEWPDN